MSQRDSKHKDNKKWQKWKRQNEKSCEVFEVHADCQVNKMAFMQMISGRLFLENKTAESISSGRVRKMTLYNNNNSNDNSNKGTFQNSKSQHT